MIQNAEKDGAQWAQKRRSDHSLWLNYEKSLTGRNPSTRKCSARRDESGRPAAGTTGIYQAAGTNHPLLSRTTNCQAGSGRLGPTQRTGLRRLAGGIAGKIKIRFILYQKPLADFGFKHHAQNHQGGVKRQRTIKQKKKTV